MDRLTWVKNLIQLSELEVGVDHVYRIVRPPQQPPRTSFKMIWKEVLYSFSPSPVLAT